jgi:hypothetical protein
VGKPPGRFKLLGLCLFGPAGRTLRFRESAGSLVPGGGRLKRLGLKPVTRVCLHLFGVRLRVASVT